MSCFGCCGDEDAQGVPDSRNPYPGHHPARTDAYRPADQPPKGPQPVKMQPIAVPAIPVDEIREVTKGFGDEALIGEGSFGRVYLGVLRNGRSAAVKKLDSNKQPDQEFLAQVSMVSRLKHENVVELLGYCADGPYVSLLTSLLLWALFMICFMEEKVLKELNLVQFYHGHNV